MTRCSPFGSLNQAQDQGINGHTACPLLEGERIYGRHREIDEIDPKRPSPSRARTPEKGGFRSLGKAKAAGLHRLHSSGIPALRSASNAGCRIGLRSIIHLTESLGLMRRASANAFFASPLSPLSPWAAAKLR